MNYCKKIMKVLSERSGHQGTMSCV